MFRNLAVSLSPAKATGVAAISNAVKVKSTTAKSPNSKKVSPKKAKSAASSPKKVRTASPKKEKKISSSPKKSKSPKKQQKTTASAESVEVAAPTTPIKSSVIESMIANSPVPASMKLPAAPTNTPVPAMSPSSCSDALMVLATPMPECRPLFTEFEATGEDVTCTPPPASRCVDAENDNEEEEFMIRQPTDLFFAATHMQVEEELAHEVVASDFIAPIAATAAAPAPASIWTFSAGTAESLEWTGTPMNIETNILSAMKVWNRSITAATTVASSSKTVTFQEAVGVVHPEIDATCAPAPTEAVAVSAPRPARFGATAPEPEAVKATTTSSGGADDAPIEFATAQSILASSIPFSEAVATTTAVAQQETHLADTFSFNLSAAADEGLAVDGEDNMVAEPEISVAEPDARVMAAFDQGFEAPQISYPEIDDGAVTLSANVHTDNNFAEGSGAETDSTSVASVAVDALTAVAPATAAPQEAVFEFKSLF